METEEQRRERLRRAETTAPIDAAWCEANGAVLLSPTFAYWKIADTANINVYMDPQGTFVALGETVIPAVTTRGQLRDLIRSMKGGAT